MTIGYQYIILVIAGVASMMWGFPAAHRLKKPFDAGAALVVLFGVLSFAFGILLTFIPGFFQGR